MLKKFVPLTADESPSKNPYEVRTFLGDNCSKKSEWKAENCPATIRKCPPNNTLAKILTIEDEIRRLNEKCERSRFQRPFKPWCTIGDDFLACIVPQRTPEELKTHAVMREYYLRAKRDLASHVHDAAFKHKNRKFIQLESPAGVTEEEEELDVEEEAEEEDAEKKPVKPELATPTCSLDAIYAPTDRLLELTCPTSGWFHNETEPPPFEEDGINYSVYNPRKLQRQLEAQKLARYDLIQGKTPLDLWTWNIGRQDRDSDLDRAKKDAVVLKFDCDKVDVKLFRVPKDLHKTFRVEIVFGNDAVQPEPPTISRQYFYRPMEIASIYVAFVDSFRLNPDFWTAETMDEILECAKKLVERSTSLNYKSTDTDFDILPQINERNAVVGFKVHFSGPIKSDPNVYKALTIYFSKYNAAVFCSKNLFLLIWKRCSKSFYIFDPNGRNESCIRDFECGKCSLISIHYIEHLVHLILRYSKAQYLADFHLYEIFLLNYGKITMPAPNKPFPKQFKRMWAVINSTFAIIPAANSGLQQPITGKEQNSSMIMALLALLYSDVERAQTWTPEVLDEINKFGATYFKHLSKRLKLKKNEQLNIMDLPEHLMMGVYKATLAKRPFLSTGHAAECKDFNDSQLTLALKSLFNGPWEMGLLQIDNSVIAVWRDNELFYIFDPFRRGRVGQVLDPDDYRTKGVACLQMHTNFESFSRNLYDKALKMRRGGKFFLHGISIKCIKPLFAAAEFPNRYPKLKLEYPEIVHEPDPEPPAEGALLDKKKKGKLPRSNSIATLPDSERLPEFSSTDVVNELLREVLCEIISGLPEPDVHRSRLYKQAEKVLLRSDLSYLNMLKHGVIHKKDEDNYYSSRQTQPDAPPQPMTLEEELLIPSNYQLLPDGTWVIFGETEMPLLPDDSMKLGGMLANIVTAALSAKYKVSTWNTELIEYALEAVNSFGEEFEHYEPTLSALLNQKLPRINIGSTTYEFNVKKIMHATEMSSLRQMLLQSLICHNRLMVICQRFSCVIFKRYNFLYMFIGFACNPVGYRKFGPGRACMLRFIELDALLRRIEFGCDPSGCEITNYVVIAIKVKDVTTEPPARFRAMMSKDEKELYLEERARLRSERRRKGDKLRFLDDQLRKENERIESFLAEKKKRADEREKAKEERRAKPAQRKKGVSGKEPQTRIQSDIPPEYDGEAIYWEEDDDEDEAEETEATEEQSGSVEPQHKRGTKLKKEITFDALPRPVLYGYNMRQKDFLYKIQGTVALPNRADASLEEIKPCFFASSVAVLYAVLRPLNQWPASRVDRVINTGLTIAGRVSNMTTAYERIIKNITADEYKFDIWVKTFEPLGVDGLSVERKINRVFSGRKYLLVQTANCTYTIYHDEYYHVFDPYGSMEKCNDGDEGGNEEEDENEMEEKKKRAHGIKKYCERNTASWVLFVDIPSMLKYIDERSANSDWQSVEEYKFHVVDIISYKKAEPKERIFQLLTDMEVSPTCGRFQEENDCARGETMAWLDAEGCIPVWSRLNRRNTAGRARGLPVTKVRKFDVEIDKRLWSVWGCLSPYAPVFSAESRGKQFLACNVVACLAANLYRLSFWSPQLLDSIVISGDQYHRESLEEITKKDFEFSLENYAKMCQFRDIRFTVHLEYVAMGKLYCHGTRKRMNLADALMYFFSQFEHGVLQCQQRTLAFGHSPGVGGGYFMFDCQSRDHPLFPKGQGASYLLRTTHLQVLVYCIVVTLNVPYYNVPFTIHKVEMIREGAYYQADTDAEESKGSKKSSK